MNRQQNDIITFENLVKLTPAFFLFYGFIYLYTYLGFFDIQVSNIYSFDEIFLVFLPIIDIIWPLGILFLVFWSMIFFLNEIQGRPLFKKFKFNSLWAIGSREIRERFYKITKRKRIIPRLLLRIFFSTTVIFYLAFMSLSYYLRSTQEVDIVGIIIVDILFALFSYHVLLILRQRFPKLNLLVKPWLIFICFALFIGFTKNLAKAVAIDTIKAMPQVCFQYEGKPYSTDKSTICIVNSKNFIVLRTKGKSANQYFEKDKIKFLETIDVADHK